MRQFARCTAVILPLLYASELAAQAPSGQVRAYRVDAGHSDVEFSIPFLYGTVRGRFDDLHGTVTYDARQPARSSVTFVIGAASVSTGSRHRDEHLRSADFFDVERFPRVTFQSTRVAAARGGFVATGPLTVHGVTREVSIPFRVAHAPVADPHGSSLVGFAGAVRLARKDFGIEGGSRFNPWFDALRSATMGDSVDVTLAVEAWDTDFGRTHEAQLDSAVARVTRDGVPALAAQARAARARDPNALKNEEWNVDRLGRALLARGRTADAVAVFRLAAELYPQSPQAQTSLGEGLSAAGDPAAAEAAFRRALALDPAETRAAELVRRVRRSTSAERI
jgi:polyisoprenoid-binding protein YceI